LTLKSKGRTNTIDLAINFEEVSTNSDREFYRVSAIQDIGDLSIFYGFSDIDLTGYEIKPGKIYKQQFFSLKELEELKLGNYHSDGFIAFLSEDHAEEKFTNKPVNVIINNPGKEIDFLKIGNPANFILTKDDKVEYVIINGF